MAKHKAIIRRNPGGRKILGSRFVSNRLTLAQEITSAERLVRTSGFKMTLRDARQEILKQRAEREKRLMERSKKAR